MSWSNISLGDIYPITCFFVFFLTYYLKWKESGDLGEWEGGVTKCILVASVVIQSFCELNLPQFFYS